MRGRSACCMRKFATFILLVLTCCFSAAATDDDHRCEVLGVDVEEIVRNVCFTSNFIDSKHSTTPSTLRWTVPVCSTDKACTTESDSIELDDVLIGSYDGRWELVRTDGAVALAVNYTLPGGEGTAATVLLRCDPDAWVTHLAVTLQSSEASSQPLYLITIAHFSLCDKFSALTSEPTAVATLAPTISPTSFPTPLGVAGEAWWYATSFECAIAWSADIEELPDAQALQDALSSVIHVISTSALLGSKKESVVVEMESDPLNSMTLKSSRRRLDSAAEGAGEDSVEPAAEKLSPWLLHATVHCVDEDSLGKIVRETRKVKKRPGELVGMLIERGVPFVDSVLLSNFTTGITSIPLSESARRSPTRILWIIMGTICLFTLLVMTIQRLHSECTENPTPFASELLCLASLLKPLYMRLLSRLESKQKQTDSHASDEESDSDDFEKSPDLNTQERSSLLHRNFPDMQMRSEGA